MPHPLDELEKVLVLLIDEHRKLLVESEKHQAAIKAVNVPAMNAARLRQEPIHKAISALESRRRSITQQIALAGKISSPTLSRLAELHPAHRAKLLGLRDELRGVIGQISQKTQVAGRVAGAVLGHLNTVMRLMAGAMQQAGVYTKRGAPKMASRIGIIEAVG